MEDRKVLEMLDDMAAQVHRQRSAGIPGLVTCDWVVKLIEQKEFEVISGGRPISVYTDGSARNNGSSDAKCGWAYRLVQGDEVIATVSGSCTGATNNQMEMYAVLRALQAIPNKAVQVAVYSDSTYVVGTLQGNYRVKKNNSQWRELFAEAAKFQNIRYVWVKGHDLNAHNIAVDKAAQMAAEQAGG